MDQRNWHEIYSEGVFSPNRDSNYFSICAANDHISVHMLNAYLDDPRDDYEVDEVSLSVSSSDFLAAIASARQGETVELDDQCSSWPSTRSYARFEPQRVVVGDWIGSSGYSMVRGVNFDKLFLDAFSVVENGEPRKRASRDIHLGPAERTLVDLVSKSPEILRSFSPRAFEVFVGSFLVEAGFSNVRLSRFVKDGGYDLYAVSYDGDSHYSLVVEVKHYSRTKVGLEIVDRLNGVRCREGVDRGMIFTTSAFSADAMRLYRYANNVISLIDYDRLVELLHQSPRWARSQSNMWSMPRIAPDHGCKGDA